MSSYRLGVVGDRPQSAVPPDTPPIVQALRYGITAPSAHNTQPWRIEVMSDTEAKVYFDPDRLLPVTDPLGRQVHISHGALVELTAIAATHVGYRAEIELLPEGEMTLAEFGAKPTAHVRLVADPQGTEDPLFAQVLHRRTSRLPHTTQAVADAERAAIGASASRRGVEAGWVPVERMAETIELAIEGMAVEVEDHDTFEETNVWFRFSDAAHGWKPSSTSPHRPSSRCSYGSDTHSHPRSRRAVPSRASSAAADSTQHVWGRRERAVKSGDVVYEV